MTHRCAAKSWQDYRRGLGKSVFQCSLITIIIVMFIFPACGSDKFSAQVLLKYLRRELRSVVTSDSVH